MIGIACLIAVFLLGVKAQLIMDAINWRIVIPPHLFLDSSEVATNFLVQDIPPMDVVIHFADKAEYARTASPDSLAFTDWPLDRWHGPCRITVLDDWQIAAIPSMGHAEFVETPPGMKKANIMAHELLHCIRAAWHPSWSQIFAPHLTVRR